VAGYGRVAVRFGVFESVGKECLKNSPLNGRFCLVHIRMHFFIVKTADASNRARRIGGFNVSAAVRFAAGRYLLM